MSHRPRPGDIRAPSHETLRNGIPSPRIEHYDGEVPPALSPLDAFAAQGRLLARQLEESARRDRRLSRLPPSSVARSLSRPRPGYFRSNSSGDDINNVESAPLERRPTQKGNVEVEEPRFRPMSEHPRFSSASNAFTEASYCDEEEDEDTNSTPRHTILSTGSQSLDVPRAESPEEDMSLRGVLPDQGPPRFYAGSTPALPAVSPSVGVSLAASSMSSSTDSASSRFLIPRSLAPPGSPFSRPSSSSKVNPESSDDDYSSSNAGSTFSKPRKMSSGSAVSVPHSPLSTTTPMPRSRPRSPSQSSEASKDGGYLQRPSLNFSRPLSRSSTNLSAYAVPQQPNHMNNRASIERGNKPGPIVVPTTTEASMPSAEEPASALSASYTYAKYPLPRGRQVSRDSAVFAGLQTPNFEWKEPLFESPSHGTPPERTSRTPSPPPAQQESAPAPKARSMYETPMSDRQLLTPEPSTPSRRRSPSPEASSSKHSPKTRKPETIKEDTESSGSSNATLRPQTARSNKSDNTTSTPVSAEDHLAVGIKCHEKGSLNESTYHLRVAAKQDHPTAMLLYALACRHGWGMRPNQQEGVRWLRKAVDSVGLEMMDATNAATPARVREMQKAYRAQFALSIYELGVSHLNGWGIEQDKSLALRCFEIAGQWGDGDALAEAGFCYAQGAGCKKDLKKAAKFYREAEAKGINMVGNSWYFSCPDSCFFFFFLVLTYF